MSYDQKVLDQIESNRNEIIAFMQKLIQTESVTGNESKIAALLSEECRKDGLCVELVEPAENRVNTVARYQGTTGKPKVMMYSHYDTVPHGEPETWKHPALSGKIVEGEIWGRGASDTKVSTCGLLMAFRTIKNLGIKLKGEIVFTHVADEEKGGKYGFKHLMDAGYGEGVDYLFYSHGSNTGERITIASNGARKWIITVKGTSAHTARNEQGVNSIYKALDLIGRLRKLGEEVNARRYRVPGTDSEMMSRFSINKIVAYVANNSVPDKCVVLIDRRFTPAETAEQTEREIQDIIDGLKAEDPEFDAEMHMDPEDWMALSVSTPDSELVKSIQRSAEKVGFKPEPVGTSASSDHGWFTSKHGKPMASYGIGGTGGHKANERVSVEDVILTTKVYALLMLDLLGAE